MMTIVYQLILVAAVVLIVRSLFQEKELKMQINAAWVLIPLILRALMLA
ncbi:MAG: hypothetical protein H6Q76_570 [Firmicutes bacterium]|nr:hypothetical protein [Bacillota bacterium]